jgi:hypothetical protein
MTPQQVGLLSAAIPSPFGDGLGLLADAAGYAQDPSSLTPGRGLLSLAALLPGIPRKVFHGTPAVFDEFLENAPKQTLGGLSKHGVSVSESSAVANRYATMSGAGAPNVRQMTFTAKKPLSLTAQEFEKLQGLVGKLDRGEPLTELEDIGLEMLFKKHGIQYGGHPIEAIKNAGFDAIEKDAGRYGIAETEALIFDKSKLKTTWGR